MEQPGQPTKKNQNNFYSHTKTEISKKIYNFVKKKRSF